MCPIALDPSARFELVLLGDLDKEAPPTFIFRHLSCNGVNALLRSGERLEELSKDANVDVLLDEMLSLVRMALVGWRGMIDPATGRPIPYDPDRLGDIVSPVELMELIHRLPEAMRLDAAAKKGYGSPSPSPSESPAGPAPAGGSAHEPPPAPATRDSEPTNSNARPAAAPGAANATTGTTS